MDKKEAKDNFREADGKFKKGNLFSLGNNGGKAPAYTDAEVMMAKIGDYLDWEDQWKNKSAKKEGKGLYTISGVALYLGFASRQSLFDYEKKSAEFAYVLNRFRLFMTHWNEQKLYWGGTFQGSFVWLKNHGGYADESTVNNMNMDIVAKYGNPEDKKDETN